MNARGEVLFPTINKPVLASLRHSYSVSNQAKDIGNMANQKNIRLLMKILKIHRSIHPLILGEVPMRKEVLLKIMYGTYKPSDLLYRRIVTVLLSLAHGDLFKMQEGLMLELTEGEFFGRLE